jgi:hypothetical protein
MQLETDIPEVVAEVRAAHERYEVALVTNDLQGLDELFWNDPKSLRFGPNGTLIGHKAISTYRRANVGPAPKRQVQLVHVVTFGTDFAVTNQEALTPDNKMTRQSQTWVRTSEGWRIVSAHVSDMPSRR